MKTEIKKIIKKADWERFNLSSKYPSIFQSWSFTEAEKKQGHTIDRFGIYRNNKLTGIAAVFLIQAKRGTFLHIRGGPILTNWETDFFSFIDFIKQYYQKNNPWFIRMSPPILKGDEAIQTILLKNKSIDAPIPLLDAETAWVLDITKSEDQLLSEMRKTTRYLIKKAMKMNVTTTVATSKKALDQLLSIYADMVKEKGIVPHSGIKEEFDEFTSDSNAVIILGTYKDKILGAALILFYGDEAIYHHSAHRREEGVPVSYLMQWNAIREAKKRGKSHYNFWGVEPTGNPKHPWFGLSLFKKGFGGNLRQFIGAKDIPLKRRYHITRTFEIIRRIKRYKSL